ncbi:acylphosphatase [Fulvivirga sp. 29W222]|uniref:acylphosphatase n=1 Tax=Fulvivirga marina TaxID=2494733 RepID=A0A937KGS5_9BACT|nr:acylphosphatase [Fulvivirga marina]MBL6449750.1 acylphosphatase [Fulvivirga marina]
MEHFNIRVVGKVQGVFYRANTRKKAYELGLTGYVRNEPDGSVYIEVEGNLNKLNEFVSWCKTGPDRAKVDEVQVKPTGPLKNFTKFEIEN